MHLPPHQSLDEVVRLLDPGASHAVKQVDAAPVHLHATRRALPPRQEARRELESEHLVEDEGELIRRSMAVVVTTRSGF